MPAGNPKAYYKMSTKGSKKPSKAKKAKAKKKPKK